MAGADGLQEFGEWFRVKLDAPFVAGQVRAAASLILATNTCNGKAVVQKMEPERLFSFTWHPYAVDPKMDYSKETAYAGRISTGEDGDGTLLVVTESGFEGSQRAPGGSVPQEEGGCAEQNEEYRGGVSRKRSSIAD